MTADLSTFRFVIPLPGGRSLSIEGDFPVTGQEWDQFVTVLEAMRPGLVSLSAIHGDAGAGQPSVIPSCPRCGETAPHIAETGPGAWHCTACGHEWESPRRAAAQVTEARDR